MNFLTLATSNENQTFLLIIFSVLMVFFLSSLIVLTYEYTFKEVAEPDHFVQSLILMAIVTSTIMQSIGDSMARGFGIFGALAILRFRTKITSPRNIAFIFASMAVGIACGVYSFFNAIIGTIAFCLIAFFLSLTPFSRKNQLIGQLRFLLPSSSQSLAVIESILKKHCKRWVLKRYRLQNSNEGPEMVEYTYELRLKNEMNGAELGQEIRPVSEVKDMRLNFTDFYSSQNEY